MTLVDMTFPLCSPDSLVQFVLQRLKYEGVVTCRVVPVKIDNDQNQSCARRSCYPLNRAKNAQPSNMSVLATHMISSNHDLEDVCVDGSSDKFLLHIYACAAKKPYKPSPSSLGSDDTSKVIHPSGFSKVTTRTSWRSLGPVPARIARAEGVYESSWWKLRWILIFWTVDVKIVFSIMIVYLLVSRLCPEIRLL